MRNKLLTQEGVLEAAERIIVEEGLDQCSMRRIASGLGVAVGTLYNYYGSREELLIDLFTKSWNHTIEKVKNVIDQEKGRKEQIIQFFQLINDDVKNRNGLGKEIFIFNRYVKEVEEKTLNIRKELSLLLESILNQKEGIENSNKWLCRWMMVILIEALVSEREIPRDEFGMLLQLIDVDFTV